MIITMIARNKKHNSFSYNKLLCDVFRQVSLGTNQNSIGILGLEVAQLCRSRIYHEIKKCVASVTTHHQEESYGF